MVKREHFPHGMLNNGYFNAPAYKIFSFVCCLIFVTRFSLLYKKIEQILGLVLTKSHDFFESFHDFVLESVHTIFLWLHNSPLT